MELSTIRLLPNVLSLARIASAFLVLPLYDPGNTYKMAVALGVIFLAEGSDHLDGLLARKLGAASDRGYILDGLADRALYSALILVISSIHDVNPLITWLLIFGQIVVYAVRLMQSNWKLNNRRVRSLHLMHWGGIRLWVTTFLVVDVCATWNLRLKLDIQVVLYAQAIIAVATIVLLYYAIALNVREALGPE